MNCKSVYIGRSKTEPGKYHVEILSENRIAQREKLYPTFSQFATRNYIVDQVRLGKILSIIGQVNFYFDCDNGEINLFGEYGRKP